MPSLSEALPQSTPGRWPPTPRPPSLAARRTPPSRLFPISFGLNAGDRQLTEGVANLLAEGAIRPVIAARYPLSEVASAHAADAAGGLGGTVIVNVRNATRDTEAPRVLGVA